MDGGPPPGAQVNSLLNPKIPDRCVGKFSGSGTPLQNCHCSVVFKFAFKFLLFRVATPLPVWKKKKKSPRLRGYGGTRGSEGIVKVTVGRV